MADWGQIVVRVWQGIPNQGGSLKGTAFLISEQHLLTATHVIYDIPEGQIYLSGRAWEGVRRIQTAPSRHPSRDVSLLTLPLANQNTPHAVFNQGLNINDTVDIYGFSSAVQDMDKPTIKIGNYDGSVNAYIAQQFIASGNSGGPAVKNGEVVGVAYARDTDQNKTYIIPYEAFADFVAPYNERPSAIPATPGDEAGSLSQQQIASLTQLLCACSSMQSVANRDTLYNTLEPVSNGADDIESDCSLLLARANQSGKIAQIIDKLKAIEADEFSVRLLDEQFHLYLYVQTLEPLINNLPISSALLRKAFFSSLPARQKHKFTDCPQTPQQALALLMEMQPGGQLTSPAIEYLVRLEIDLDDNGYTNALNNSGIPVSVLTDLRNAIQFQMTNKAEPDLMLVEVMGSLENPEKLRVYTRQQPHQQNQYVWNKLEEQILADETMASAFNRILEKTNYAPGSTLIELLVSREMFLLNPAQWQLSDELQGTRALGLDYPLVMRWSMRMLEPHKAACGQSWRNKFAQIRSKSSQNVASETVWIKETDVAEQIKNNVINNGDYVGIEFVPPVCPASAKDRMTQALLGGAPFVFWLNRPTDDPQMLKACVQQLVNAGDLDDLPGRLHQLRQENLNQNAAHIVNQLSLLWDNPDHLPPELDDFQLISP